MPFFSIIIPTLNAESFLPYTLESILCQSFRNFEIIIVDSLSKDTTYSIVDRMRDERVRFVSRHDSSMYQAINYGLSIASSKIFSYINSDDLLHDSDVLMRAHDILFSWQDKSFLAYGNSSYIDNRSSYLFNRRSFCDNFSSALRRGRVCFAQPAAFWSRLLWRNLVSFDENFFLASDFDFFLRALESCDSNIHLPFIVSSFRMHSNSLSSRRSAQLAREVKLIQSKHGLIHDRARLFYEIKPKIFNIDNYFHKLVNS